MLAQVSTVMAVIHTDTRDTIAFLYEKDIYRLIPVYYYILGSKIDFNCSTNSCFQKVLFGWDIKVGSVGVEMGNGSILWEFGNGKDYADFE